MKNKLYLNTKPTSRNAFFTAIATVLLSLSAASVKAQAPPPGDLADTSSGISSVTNNKTIPVWSSGNEVNIDLTDMALPDARVDIYEVTGQLIFDEKIASGSVYRKQLNIANAEYVIVRITNAGGWITRKLFIPGN